MKPWILSLIVALLLQEVTHAASEDGAWITLDQTAWDLLQQTNPGLNSVSSRRVNTGVLIDDEPTLASVYLVKVSESDMQLLPQLVHEKLFHCAGFFAFDSREAAMEFMLAQPRTANFTRPDYSIDYQGLIAPMLVQMSADRIEDTIITLSAFRNRFYNGSYGAEAANWLADHWATLAGLRSDVSIEKVFRGTDAMPSIVLTIEGNELSEQVVVLGGHLDSVNVIDRGSTSHQNSIAPGADDDASGVAGLTEILRQLMSSDYRPRRTIKLMAYSGEEFGLFGSNFIATDFADRNVDVVGVLQLDMTNYQGSVSDMFLIDDYTDAQQNQFLEGLVQAYLPSLKVAHSICGYACSDHASWSRQGYVASFPFEAGFGEHNPAIHSTLDTYAGSGSQANHALKFTRLGLAYAVELGEVSTVHIFEDGFESPIGPN